MEGQDITGSDYAVLSGVTTLPDMRGGHMRSMDVGRGLDPDGGSRAVLESQNPTTGPHRHSIVRGGGGPGTGSLKDQPTGRFLDGLVIGNGSNYVGAQENLFGSSSASPALARTGSTGSEARAKQVNINHFIRINF
jgi:hypothetical protein